MKKFASLFFAVLLAVTMLSVSSVAFADSVNSPTASTLTTTTEKTTQKTTTKKTTTKKQKTGGPKTTVNGSSSDDIEYNPKDPSEGEITFRYTGEGTLIRWETNLDELGLEEGKDYTITYNDDDSMTINFISDDARNVWYNEELIVNAVVKTEETTTKASTTKASTTKKDDSHKSPETGMNTAVLAGSLAAVCAGAVMLAAKKKND